MNLDQVTLVNQLEVIDQLVTDLGGEWSFRMDLGSDCYWACECRVTLKPGNTDGPDESMVWYWTGMDSEHVLCRNGGLDAVVAWCMNPPRHEVEVSMSPTH